MTDPFRFQDVFKRLIEVGWAQSDAIFLVIEVIINTQEQVEGSATPPGPRDTVATILMHDSTTPKNFLTQYAHPENPPNPDPGNLDWPPPYINLPITPEMLATYHYWWPNAPHQDEEFGQPETEPGEKVLVMAASPVIWPDSAPNGPEGVYPNESDAQAAIDAFKESYPGWALIDYWIIPIEPGGPAYAFTQRKWRANIFVNLPKYEHELVRFSPGDNPVINFDLKIHTDDGGTEDFYFVSMFATMFRGTNITRNANTGDLNFDNVEWLADSWPWYDIYRNSDNPTPILDTLVKITFDKENSNYAVSFQEA